jgi:hypothetical protein
MQPVMHAARYCWGTRAGHRGHDRTQQRGCWYLTTSGCGTTSAGRCLTAERASGASIAHKHIGRCELTRLSVGPTRRTPAADDRGLRRCPTCRSAPGPHPCADR